MSFRAAIRVDIHFVQEMTTLKNIRGRVWQKDHTQHMPINLNVHNSMLCDLLDSNYGMIFMSRSSDEIHSKFGHASKHSINTDLLLVSDRLVTSMRV